MDVATTGEPMTVDSGRDSICPANALASGPTGICDPATIEATVSNKCAMPASQASPDGACSSAAQIYSATALVSKYRLQHQDEDHSRLCMHEKFQLLTRDCPRGAMDEIFDRLQTIEREADFEWLKV
jgi:hypothetical protein